MRIDKHYYVLMEGLETYPHILSGISDSPYIAVPGMMVLGESDNVTSSQRVMLLIGLNEGQKIDNLMAPKVFELREIASLAGHDLTIAYCAPQLIQLFQQRLNEHKMKGDGQESQIQRAFMDLLSEALSMGASDIHVEVRRVEASVRYRIDGELTSLKTWPRLFALQFAQVVYSVVAEEQDVTFKPDQPQDAVIDKMIGGERVRVRLATIPAAPDGFDMIMRLLPLGKQGNQKALPLLDLGYSEEHVRMITAGMSKPVGVVIMAGTTGSGKSTTLKNMLLSVIEKAKGTIKVITVEDPPEYFIPGATQVPVSRNRKTSDGSSSFEAAIRAAMRSDPDIIMVGEVRDLTTVKLLTGAVQSGHQAYTTIHAPSAIGIISRLTSLGAERDILGSTDFIACMIYQSLLAKLCPHCKVALEYAAQDSDRYGLENDLMERIRRVTTRTDTVFVRGEGCEKCNGGVKGKTVVAEVILPDHYLLKYFAESRSIDALEYWLKTGGKPILLHGIDKMRAGIVSPHDVEASLGFLSALEVMSDGVMDINKEIGLLPASLHEHDGNDVIDSVMDNYVDQFEEEISSLQRTINAVLFNTSNALDDIREFASGDAGGRE